MQALLTPEQEAALSRRLTGKLLLQSEIPLSTQHFKALLKATYFTRTSSIIRKNYTYQCQRCHNQIRSLFASMPCLTCERDVIYCRKCIEMGRVIMCEPLYYWTGSSPAWPVVANPCTWEGQLTEAQQVASDRITQAIIDQEKRLLVWGVCGSGKTEMLFQGIALALARGKRVCLATPRADVVRELLPRFQTSFADLTIHGLYGGSEENEGSTQFVIATTHQLLRFQDAFDVLIIDENDAFPYHNDPSLPFAAERAKRDASTTIYLTATPRKQQRLQIRLKTLPHIFVPIRFHGHPLPVPQLKMSLTLQKELASLNPPTSFIEDLIKRLHPERQILIFVPTIELATTLTPKLGEHLMQAKLLTDLSAIQAVHAEDADREEKIMSFRRKELTILVTTTILERGVTFPGIDVFIFDAGHSVFDEAALVQIAGRAGRSPVDPTGDVVFYHDGKTKAMVQAIKSIKLMNQRGGFA